MKVCARLLVLSALLAAAAAAAASPCTLGPPAPEARVWSGDFDGDGVADRLWILPPAAARPAARREWVRDPWRSRQQAYDPAVMALVLAAGGARSSAACIVIQNRRFFATPIWEGGDKPVRILPRSDPEAQGWRQVARHWRGDGILLGTEAGVDVLLYRDGRRYRIAYGSEAP
jgi:hypothetical protein